MKFLYFPTLLLTSVLLIAAAGIDLNNLPDYVGLDIPNYVLKDNTPPFNDITNEGATLGRVLFYDKKLSANNTISCASCHQQQFAFSDTSLASVGLHGGFTGRHSMRLVNSRFGDENRFFWDKRALSLEDQSTKPIQDHVEMGFSGFDGAPTLDSLIRKLEGVDYYKELFTLAFGDDTITEARMQQAISQFVRSITSFDSRFDSGFVAAANLLQPFPNFTQEENMGKMIFIQPAVQGGAGCQGCHQAPEFDIDPNSGNNGVIGVIGDSNAVDLTNTRAPSLRNLVNPDGVPNGPFMHDGSMKSLLEVVNHYDSINFNPMENNLLDGRLRGAGGPGQGPPQGQRLRLDSTEKAALVAFLKTLTGVDVYTNEIWSDPFDEGGNLNYTSLNTASNQDLAPEPAISIYPNPASDYVKFDLPLGEFDLNVLNLNGQVMGRQTISHGQRMDLSLFGAGVYFFHLSKSNTKESYVRKVVIR